MLVAIGSKDKILELKINFPAKKKKKKYPKTREGKFPSELPMASESNTSSHWKKNMLINENREEKYSLPNNQIAKRTYHSFQHVK